LQHLVCWCIVFHWSLFLKNPQETQSLKNRRWNFASLLKEFATRSFGGIDSFLGLLCMNPWKLTRKVDRRKDTLEFSRADFSTLQTKSIDGQKQPLNYCGYEWRIHAPTWSTLGRQTITSNLTQIWAHRPSIKSTKPLFILIKAIIITRT